MKALFLGWIPVAVPGQSEAAESAPLVLDAEPLDERPKSQGSWVAMAFGLTGKGLRRGL
jgi:hypothetical protein